MNSEPTYDLAGQVIGCAMNVHRVLGSGFLESVYENALALELNSQGIPFERQKELIVSYRDQTVGQFRADLLIDQQLIIELKAVHTLSKIHEVQLVNYLTATQTEEGLLLNFGKGSLEFRNKFLRYQPPRLQK